MATDNYKLKIISVQNITKQSKPATVLYLVCNNNKLII